MKLYQSDASPNSRGYEFSCGERHLDADRARRSRYEGAVSDAYAAINRVASFRH